MTAGIPELAGPVVAETRRDVLWVRGADAVNFLQGQLSADVAGLEPRTSGWSLLLQPQGKVSAWLRVSRVDDAEVLLDVDEGWGPGVEARLRRFMIRVAVELQADNWPCVSVRGPGSNDVPYPTAATVVADAEWPGMDGLDFVGPHLSADVLPGLERIGSEELETLRVLAGVPALGVDIGEDTIPAEAGQWLIDASVSFTKGCYTGQELVARVDSRGSNTPHRLRRLDVPPGSPTPPTGAEVRLGPAGTSDDAKVVGSLGSVAASRFAPGPVALAMLHRSVEPGESVTISWDGGSVAAVVASPG